jgi:hypothetical protein
MDLWNSQINVFFLISDTAEINLLNDKFALLTVGKESDTKNFLPFEIVYIFPREAIKQKLLQLIKRYWFTSDDKWLILY